MFADLVDRLYKMSLQKPAQAHMPSNKQWPPLVQYTLNYIWEETCQKLTEYQQAAA